MSTELPTLDISYNGIIPLVRFFRNWILSLGISFQGSSMFHRESVLPSFPCPIIVHLLYGHTTVYLPTHWSGRFHFGAIMNNAATNTHIQVFVCRHCPFFWAHTKRWNCRTLRDSAFNIGAIPHSPRSAPGAHFLHIPGSWFSPVF